MVDEPDTTDTKAAPGAAPAAGATATPDPNDYAAALREATAAKRGETAAAAAKAADDKNPDPKPGDQSGKGDDDKGDAADTAGAADKSAGADTAASKATGNSPSNAEIKVDWSKVNPALKATYEAGSPEVKAALEATLVSELKRGQEISSLRKTISQGKHRRTPASTSSRVGRGATDLKKVLSGPAMTALEKEAPEVTAAFREATGPLIAELENANKDLGAMAVEELRAEADYQAATLAEVHPDWEKVTESTPFNDWLAKAAPHVKAMVARNAVVSAEFPQGRIIDGQEAAHVLSLFKETTGFGTAAGVSPAPGAKANGTGGSQQPSPVDKKRSLQRESARDTAVRGAAAASGTDENDFAANLREATRLKAQERQRQTA